MGLSWNPNELLRPQSAFVIWQWKASGNRSVVKGSPVCLISNGNSIPKEQASHLKHCVCVWISVGYNPYTALVMWSSRRTLIRPKNMTQLWAGSMSGFSLHVCVFRPYGRLAPLDVNHGAAQRRLWLASLQRTRRSRASERLQGNVLQLRGCEWLSSARRSRSGYDGSGEPRKRWTFHRIDLCLCVCER